MMSQMRKIVPSEGGSWGCSTLYSRAPVLIIMGLTTSPVTFCCVMLLLTSIKVYMNKA